MDSLFFIASKVLRPFLSPSTWLLIIPLIAWLCSRWRLVKLSRSLWAVELLLLFAIGFYPVGQWLARPLEHFSQLPSATTEAPDGIIVLGGAWLTDQTDYWQQWELNQAAERELAFVVLARKYPQAKLVFTGGSGKLFSQDVSEASIARRLYQDLGIDIDRIVFEGNSRNTYENGVFSQQLLSPQVDENWWLITSAYHMPRSLGVFCQLGWTVTPYPVDHFVQRFSWIPKWALADHLWELERITQEWAGLFVYRLTGKTNKLFPYFCG